MSKFKPGPDPRRGKGGARPGAGRPGNWIKAIAAEQLKKHKLLEYVGDVGAGKDGKAEVKDRLKAVEFLTKTAEDKLADSHTDAANPVYIMLPGQQNGESGEVKS